MSGWDSEVDKSNWDFDTLDDYRRWIDDRRSGQFSFKVGVFESSKRVVFDQHGFFFSSFIPDPPMSKQELAKSSILGEHLYHCINLNAEHLFESPKEFARQGDIFAHEDPFPQIANRPSCWMLTSQTCTIANELYCTLAPVYDDDTSIETTLLKSFNPVLSLSFPGNAYVCCRLAMYQFRDVENWDDQRTTKLAKTKFT